MRKQLRPFSIFFEIKVQYRSLMIQTSINTEKSEKEICMQSKTEFNNVNIL